MAGTSGDERNFSNQHNVIHGQSNAYNFSGQSPGVKRPYNLYNLFILFDLAIE
jgi:hypothetical protein